MANLLPLIIGGAAAFYLYGSKKKKPGSTSDSTLQRDDLPSGDGEPTSGVKDGWGWRVGEVPNGDFGVLYVSEIQRPGESEWKRVHGEPRDFTGSRNLALEAIAIFRAEDLG